MQQAQMPYETEQVVHFDACDPRIRLHPKNMRRVYDQKDIDALAASIRARGRVLQPLIGVEVDGTIYIVLGNKRLLAVRQLGDDRPTLPVILRPISELEQMLDQVAENMIRSSPDPISQGLHYRMLQKEYGLTVAEIARRTGATPATIKNRLRMLLLPEEVQRLYIAGKLPKNSSVIEALLALPGEVQVKAAEGFAATRASPRVIKSVCSRLLKEAERRKAAVPEPEPIPTAWDGILSWEEIQAAFSVACEGCTARPPAWLLVESDLPHKGPLWADVQQVNESLCENCGLRTVKSLCGHCQVVDFVRLLVQIVNRRLRDADSS